MKDADGKIVSPETLCRTEPAWAASRIRQLERDLDSLFDALDLERPEIVDPIIALRLDVARLKDAERLWVEACAIARACCPVEPGESHIRHGIPRLAQRVSDLTKELEER